MAIRWHHNCILDGLSCCLIHRICDLPCPFMTHKWTISAKRLVAFFLSFRGRHAVRNDGKRWWPKKACWWTMSDSVWEVRMTFLWPTGTRTQHTEPMDSLKRRNCEAGVNLRRRIPSIAAAASLRTMTWSSPSCHQGNDAPGVRPTAATLPHLPVAYLPGDFYTSSSLWDFLQSLPAWWCIWWITMVTVGCLATSAPWWWAVRTWRWRMCGCMVFQNWWPSRLSACWTSTKMVYWTFYLVLQQVSADQNWLSPSSPVTVWLRCLQLHPNLNKWRIKDFSVAFY